jgi:Flp pilus assembly protein TadD
VAAILFAVLLIYAPVCNPKHPAEWLGDDDDLLTKNLTVQHRLSADPAQPPAHLATLAKLWLAPDGLDYFPLTSTVLWAQWPLFSMAPEPSGPVPPGRAGQAVGLPVPWPTGYHATNVVLHFLGSLALWRLFSVMKIPGAFLGAILFAVHPVCVESVAWVSELKNTLSLPLFLLAAAEYVRCDDLCGGPMGPGPAGDRSRATVHLVRSVVLFLLAMLAKTSVVAFPVVILLYVWWKRNAVTARDVVRASPFFLISIVLGLVTVSFQYGRAIGGEKIIVGGAASRLATAGMSLLWYLRLLAWPYPLLPNYPRWQVDPPQAWQFLPWLVIAAVAWWCWRNRSGWGRHAILGLGFFVLMVAPVLGFVTISYMRITWAADHFIYAPMIGIVGLAAAGVAAWCDRSRPELRWRIATGTAVVIGVLAVLSFRYAARWVSPDSLWTYTLERNEACWYGHSSLGLKKLSRQHLETIEPAQRIEDLGALHHLARAVDLRPDLGDPHNNLGAAYSAMARSVAIRGDLAEAGKLLNMAIREYAEACRLLPRANSIRKNLANTLGIVGRFEEAAALLRDTLAEEPNDPVLLNNYGMALQKIGRTQEAIVQYRRALEIAPGLAEAQRNLAVASGEQADRASQPSRSDDGRPAASPGSNGQK